METSSNSGASVPPGWLTQYGSKYYDWHRLGDGDQTVHYRPLGIVEGSFDSDGTDFEGRADLHAELALELRLTPSSGDLRHKILLAWAVLRSQHVLLSAKALDGARFLRSSKGDKSRYFVAAVPMRLQQMMDEARKQLQFANDGGCDSSMDPVQFKTHLLNTARLIDPIQALAKLVVLPEKRTSTDHAELRCFFIVAHQISDGLTIFRWMSHFVDLLNHSESQLGEMITALCRENTIASRLPPAQEALYPPIAGSAARQRWSWLLSRILRHTRRPPPASFPNPLLRSRPFTQAEAMPETFTGILDYSRAPPLNTFSLAAPLSTPATRNLIKLCREARISVGAGCFALVGLVMMLFHEHRHPNMPLSERKPFVGSFPLNPRPFLAGTPTSGNEDSLMLAFSDGLALPFLPSDLPVEGRLKLLGRLADSQLRIYQKRARSAHDVLGLGSRSPGQMIPALYLGSIERMEAKALPERKTGVNPQGAYPARVSETGATCGVSSVGDTTRLIRSKHDVHDSSRDFVADYRGLRNTVKARDGEFLVGAGGDAQSLGFSVSYDGCAVDAKLAEQWGRVLQTILLPTEGSDKQDFSAKL